MCPDLFKKLVPDGKIKTRSYCPARCRNTKRTFKKEDGMLFLNFIPCKPINQFYFFNRPHNYATHHSIEREIALRVLSQSWESPAVIAVGWGSIGLDVGLGWNIGTPLAVNTLPLTLSFARLQVAGYPLHTFKNTLYVINTLLFMRQHIITN